MSLLHNKQAYTKFPNGFHENSMRIINVGEVATDLIFLIAVINMNAAIISLSTLEISSSVFANLRRARENCFSRRWWYSCFWVRASCGLLILNCLLFGLVAIVWQHHRLTCSRVMTFSTVRTSYGSYVRTAGFLGGHRRSGHTWPRKLLLNICNSLPAFTCLLNYRTLTSFLIFSNKSLITQTTFSIFQAICQRPSLSSNYITRDGNALILIWLYPPSF